MIIIRAIRIAFTIWIFISGFNYKTLPTFQKLHHVNNGEEFADHLSLMANEMYIQDIETLQSDIFDTYNVRIIIIIMFIFYRHIYIMYFYSVF